MTNRKTFVFLAAVLCIALAIAVSVFIPHSAKWALAIFAIFGSVVTYQYPVSGATAPTGQKTSMVTATVNVVDTDTTAVITHNFGLSATQLAQLLPLIFYSYSAYVTNTGTVLPNISFSSAANAITMTKLSAVGSAGTIVVQLLRPNSIIE